MVEGHPNRLPCSRAASGCFRVYLNHPQWRYKVRGWHHPQQHDHRMHPTHDSLVQNEVFLGEREIVEFRKHFAQQRHNYKGYTNKDGWRVLRRFPTGALRQEHSV